MIRSMVFYSEINISISLHLQTDLALNTATTSDLVFVIAIWMCWISYRYDYEGLLILYFPLLLGP